MKKTYYLYAVNRVKSFVITCFHVIILSVKYTLINTQEEKMNQLFTFLEEKKVRIKKASLWIQSLLLFLLFFVLIYASHLGSHYRNFSSTSLLRNISTVTSMLYLVLVFSGSSYLLFLLTILSEPKKEYHYYKIIHVLSIIMTFAVAWVFLGYVETKAYSALSKNHIYLFLSFILVIASIYALYQHIYRGKVYLITREIAENYYENTLDWWKSLPQKVITKLKSAYSLFKEYYDEFNRVILPAEIVNMKKSQEASPETETRIQEGFKKPIYLRKSYIVFVTFCFCFQFVNSYYLLKDWSKTTVDVFENIIVTFHGISGEGFARIEIMPYSDDPKLNEFYETLGFRIENNTDLKNGDSVTIVLVRYDEEMMEDRNYKFETTSKEFTIARLDTIPKSLIGVSGVDELQQTMVDYMNKRQNFMTRYSYTPMIECYSPKPEKSTHYAYFIDAKYGVLLRVYDVQESFSKNDVRTSFDYAFLLIYDHIVINSNDALNGYQLFKAVKIGDIDYLEYMKELRSRNNFSCTYLGE